MNDHLGIDSTKKIVGLAFKIGTALKEVFEDGKLTFFESLGLISDLKDVPEMIQLLPELKKELADLDPDEVNELLNYIEQKFDISSDKVEAKVDACIKYLTATAELIQELKK